jgi:transcriptional/translational regulatory protein YebC/TACO1
VVANGKDPEEIELIAIEAGADDVRADGETVEVETMPTDLESVRQELEGAGLEIDNADLAMVATNTVQVEDKIAHQVMRLIEGLEDLEDVQRVYSNADFSDEAMESYGA